MKIQLIHPPADEDYKSPEARWLQSPPIGLELIASRIPAENSIEIIDGNNVPLDEILSRINGDYVGVSDWYSKHKNALTILKEAKKRGATTIIGGPNATHLAERILRNHIYVDYAVKGDGEEALRGLVKGRSLDTIPNLIYRDKDKIKKNSTINVTLTNIFDLEHITNLTYDSNRPIPISAIRGCIKAELEERCSFCSMDHRLRVMNPRLVWNQIDLLNDKYGLKYFFETGDSFIVGKYPEMLLASRPRHLEETQFRIYASPNQINERTIKTLQSLNVREIFLGVESTNEQILKKAGKPYTKRDIESALQNIHGTGIEVQVPFIYGLPGETQATMEESYRFAKSVAETFPQVKLLISTPIPLVGSKLFDNLRVNPEIRRRYSGNLDEDDTFDYASLIKLQTEQSTYASYQSIKEYVTKTKELVRGDNVAGMGII